MKFLLSAVVVSLLLSSCNKKEEPSVAETPTDDYSTLLLIEKADSAWNKKLGHDPNFKGVHAHGKDLAVHAHQNIPKKRKILQISYERQDEFKESNKQQLDRRRQILIERGLLKEDSTDTNSEK